RSTASLTAKHACLRGNRGEACEPIRLCGAEFGQLFVLDLDDLSGEITLAVVPEGIDRQHLHVDCLRRHCGEPLVDLDEGFFCAVDRWKLEFRSIGAEQRAGLAEVAVSV